MNFTRQNIKNRTVLARCCYADMLIDMMEASASGDNELYNCMKKKAWLLRYAISQMCDYESHNIFGKNIAQEPIINAKVLYTVNTFADANTAEGVNINSATLGGVNLVTPGAALTTGVTTWGQVMANYSNMASNFTPLNDEGVYYLNSSSTVNSDGNVVTTTSIYYDANLLGAEPAYNATTSPAFPTATYTLNYSSLSENLNYFTNGTARKFLNQMDEYCGCPCGDNSKVLNDTLPKYI
jgi:hypothetical protein